MVSGISINGFPPYMKKNKITQENERIMEFDQVELKSKKIERDLAERNKEFIKIYYSAINNKSKTEIS